MNDEVTMTGSEPDGVPGEVELTKTEKKKRKVEEQDRRVENDITQVKQEIQQAIAGDTAFQAEMTKLGFDSGEYSTGLGYCEAAQTAFTNRRTSLGRLEATSIAQDTGDRTLNTRLVDYREVVRIAFPRDIATQRALGAVGVMPVDRQRRITYARACFQAAGEASYAEQMARRGYNKEELDKAIADADALSRAIDEFRRAEREAKDATQARQQAYAALKAWALPFRRAVRRARARTEA
jgi:hypothetical protein